MISECLESWRCKTHDGYPRIMMKEGTKWKVKRLNRVVWEQNNGPIPPNLCVCHKCDNPGCVNINHLFLGTRKDNSQDMIKKNRQPNMAGTHNGNSKLNEYQVQGIREKYKTGMFTYKELGLWYGVSDVHVGDIINNKRWRILP